MLSPLPNLLLKFVSTISKEQVLDLSVKIKRSLTYLKSSPQWIATASIFKIRILTTILQRLKASLSSDVQDLRCVLGTLFRSVEQLQNFDPAVISITSPLRRLLVLPSLSYRGGNALPATRIGAGDRTPPTDVIFPSGVFFYESLEGMRVTAQDAVAVSPTNIRANSSEL